ncbi:hypothetical protein [Streptomyces barringtoniae]|uniref:hypothetical protein n=1 Tax=Streptomyces barringtoniae TaxID=2892029 RepID=UPI001E5600E2|nr:hypothetical protein [Streptomyces barringtoniae]MCC5475746.1 hypothetical protein [Streptomyces barringtoniae]
MAVGAVGDGVVAVGGGIDGDDVGAVGQVRAAGDGRVPVAVVGGGDPAGFGGDEEAAGRSVVGVDVGVPAGFVGCGGAEGGQVGGGEAVVGVAGGRWVAAGGLGWMVWRVDAVGRVVIGVCVGLITGVRSARRLVRQFSGTGVLGALSTLAAYTAPA